MGVDGSGKTTLSKKLKNTLKQSKYLHLKPYILFQDRRRVVKKPHNQKKSKSFVSFLRLLSWIISYKVFFYRNKKNFFFIFDRYAHDILIDPLRYKHDLSKNLTNFLLNFFPKPDLWVFLNPSFKTIKSRKHELSDDDLRHQITLYSNFFKKEKNVLIINTIVQSKISLTKIKKKVNFLNK